MIPPILHFVWINQGSADFGEGEYASLLSAIMNTSYEIYLHTDLKKSSIKGGCNPYSLKHARFRIVHHDISTTIEGVKLRMANVSDIYRILILHAYGGMYSDLDMLWKKNVDVDLKKLTMLAGWENPSYKLTSNAFIGCREGYPPLLTLVEDFLKIIEKLRLKGVYDVTGPDPTHKFHIMFLKVTQKFVKEHCTLILPKQYFFKNGFRRIARVFRKMRMSFRNQESISQSQTEDCLDFAGITAFHYYNDFFPFRKLVRIPAVRREFSDVLEALPC